MSPTTCPEFPMNCGALQPNPDIAGVGVSALPLKPTSRLTGLFNHSKVYVAFIASAVITLAAAGLKFFCGGSGRPFTQRLDAALNSLILGLADQQMVTGLAILIGALKGWDDISAYHYNLIVYIAWFSSFTHVVALLSLDYFTRKSKALQLLRGLGVLAVFALYVFAQRRSRTFGNTAGLLAKSSGEFPGAAASCPARCSVEKHASTLDERFRITALVVLMAIALFDGVWNAIYKKQSPGSLISFILGLLMLAAFGLAIMSLVFGISGAMHIRDLGRYPGLLVADNFGDQSSWSFGQLVAVILLILPFLAATEGFLEERTRQNFRKANANKKIASTQLELDKDKRADVERLATISKEDGSQVTSTGATAVEPTMFLRSVPSAEPQEITPAGGRVTPR
ncbi:uncharacterized protein BP5553_03502 [Venustampulla echinocandica]|uniref:Uncharacterized protein n=1 Tax=Venustampulla echinocandica TaxID=2656787 RepID=A0A370TUF0_9HELO|nr:uncharacterized protein BP5553_03502 [Venustampulla echinocandica]RDL39162.1 hypothetical protein BP5553_03502 [Venustampulla echinocandica]